jgi:hypothetical protein
VEIPFRFTIVNKAKLTVIENSLQVKALKSWSKKK